MTVLLVVQIIVSGFQKSKSKLILVLSDDVANKVKKEENGKQ